MCIAFSDGGSSPGLVGVYWSTLELLLRRRRNAMKCPSWTEWLFGRCARLCVYMFVCQPLQSLGRIFKVQAGSVIRSWIFFSSHVIVPLLCLPFILLSSEAKTKNLHITLSSQQKQFNPSKNVSDENNMSSTLNNQPVCRACLHTHN